MQYVDTAAVGLWDRSVDPDVDFADYRTTYRAEVGRPSIPGKENETSTFCSVSLPFDVDPVEAKSLTSPYAWYSYQ